MKKTTVKTTPRSTPKSSLSRLPPSSASGKRAIDSVVKGSFHDRRLKRLREHVSSLSIEKLEERIKKRILLIQEDCHWIEHGDGLPNSNLSSFSSLSTFPSFSCFPSKLDPSCFHQGIRAIAQATSHAPTSSVPSTQYTRWVSNRLCLFITRLIQLLSYGLEHCIRSKFHADHLFVLDCEKKLNRLTSDPKQFVFDSQLFITLCQRLLHIVYTHRDDRVDSFFPNYLYNQMTMDTVPNMTIQEMYIWRIETDDHLPQLREHNICSKCHKPYIYLKKESRFTCRCNGQTITYFPMRHVQADVPKQNTEYERMKSFRRTIYQYVEGAPQRQQKKLTLLKQECMKRGCFHKTDIQKSMLKSILQDLEWKSEERSIHRLHNDMIGIEYTLFTTEQAEECMQMFQLLEEAYSRLKGNKNLKRQTFPRVDFAMDQFCRMKGWLGQRNAFQSQKVSKVLDQQMHDWALFIQVLAELDPTRPWMTYETR